VADAPANPPTDDEKDPRPNYAKPAPRTHGSPSDLQLKPDLELRWYLPTWRERLRFMGWRNLLWIPSMALAATMLLVPWFWPVFWQITIGWWKLWVMAVALPLGAAAQAARHTLRLRRDPFCIHCGYSLTGLPDGHACPECGQPCNHQVIQEYRRDPHWFIDRYKNRNNIPRREATIMAGPHRRAANRDGT